MPEEIGKFVAVLAALLLALGGTNKLASAFAEKDWTAVLVVCQTFAKLHGIISFIAAHIGVSRAQLSGRIKENNTSIVRPGRPGTVPLALQQAIKARVGARADVAACMGRQNVLQNIAKVYVDHGLSPAEAPSRRVVARFMVKPEPAVAGAAADAPLSRRSSEASSTGRVLNMTKTNMDDWYDKMELVGVKTLHPNRVLNFDESDPNPRSKKKILVSLSCFLSLLSIPRSIVLALYKHLSHSHPQVWARKGDLARHQVHEAEKHVSIVPTVTAEGRLLAMTFIIQGTRFKKAWGEAWPGAYFIMTESGGMDAGAYDAFQQMLMKKLGKEPALILADGHVTRTSRDVWLNTMEMNQNGQVTLLNTPLITQYRRRWRRHRAGARVRAREKAAEEQHVALKPFKTRSLNSSSCPLPPRRKRLGGQRAKGHLQVKRHNYGRRPECVSDRCQTPIFARAYLNKGWSVEGRTKCGV